MEFQYYMIVQLIFFIFIAIFIGNEIKRSQAYTHHDKRITYFTLAFIVLGILLRTLNLSYPHGVFVDEAMGAYDSWSLANYGVDSNLNSYPVYLRSWGTGQSALYAYLTLPFIKVLGLNAEAYRLPSSLIGCCSLLFFYYTLKRVQKPINLVALCTFFLAINPWHIMKSRFGLDCNICPDLLLIASCFFILYLYNNTNKRFFHLSFGFIFLYLAAYAYGVSWLMLPVFYIGLIIYIIKKRKTDQRKIIYTALASLIILVPLILFAVVLFFRLDTIEIGAITMPALTEGRHNKTMTLFQDLNITSVYNYIKISVKILILGSDFSTRFVMNAIAPYGTFYNLFSLIFVIIGMYQAYKRKGIINTIFGLWLIASIPIVILVSPMVWHWNIIWIPLIYFTAYGIFIITEKKEKIFKLITLCYIVLFAFFVCAYFNRKKNEPFYSWTYENELRFTKTLKVDKVYYPWEFTQAEILFYNPISPYTFANTRVDKGESIKIAKSFDNVIIALPNDICPTPKTAYLIPNNIFKYIDRKQFKIKEGKYYSVLWNE